MWLFAFNIIFILVLGILLWRSARTEDRTKHNLFLMISLGYFALLAMLRSQRVGNDTARYCIEFLRIASQSHLRGALAITGRERGFVILNYAVSRLSNSPQLLIAVCAAFVFFSTYQLFRKYSRLPWLSVFMFFTLMIFDFFLSGLRQSIAIGVLFFAYDAMVQKKIVRYYVLVILATMFHTTALAFLFVYPIVRIGSNKMYMTILAAGAVAIMIAWKPFLQLMLHFFPRYLYYVGESEFGGDGKTAVLCKAAVYFSVLIFGEFLKERRELPPKNYEDTVNFRLTALLMLVSVMSLNATVFSRLCEYLEPFVCLYLPNALILRKEEKNKEYAIALLVICFSIYALVIHLFRTPEWQSTYPYSFFWQ